MIVVSDTSPINYLVLIEFEELLPKLFDRILIPHAVCRELQADGTPDRVRQFIAAAPDWVEVRPAPEIPAALVHLDSGEREALALALAVGANFVLVDELNGCRAAEGLGLEVYGTLGVILIAAERNLIAREDALDRLQRTNFRVSPRLLESVRAGTPRD